MQLKNYFWNICIGTVLVALTSCSSGKSYAEKLEDEENAIDNFISSNGLEILYDFPSDSTTGENQYIKFSNGLLMHIYNRGNLSLRAKKNKTEICLRYRDCLPLLNPNDLSLMEGNWYDSHSSGYEFIYGYCDREGWNFPIQFLGDGAEVALIVPSGIGTSTQQSDVTPFYYGRVKYTFVK